MTPYPEEPPKFLFDGFKRQMWEGAPNNDRRRCSPFLMVNHIKAKIAQLEDVNTASVNLVSMILTHLISGSITFDL